MITHKLIGCQVLGTIALWAAATGAIADSDTVSEFGISSQNLAQTGLGVTVGQVEATRAQKPFFDDAANTSLFLNPTEVYVGASVAAVGLPEITESDPLLVNYEHAMGVASVIIAEDSLAVGVAPDAMLHSAGIALQDPSFAGRMAEYASTTETILQNTSGQMSVINHSYGLAEPNGYTRDGSALLSLYMDWSARNYDVVQVFAVDQVDSDNGTGSVPEDSYNGINVGASRTELTSFYRQADDENRPVVLTGQSNLDLIAPGISVDVTGLGDATASQSGTSVSAPHVTGTVALLQQRAFEDNVLGLADQDAYRHEVMKAVILNSADKIQDAGDGKRLNMSRDILRFNVTQTWLDGPAYSDEFLALDPELGAGHLNATRAMTQFARGEHDAVNGLGTVVPQIGWDYANTNDTGAFWNEYEFEDPLPAGSFVSITAVWDRKVDFVTDNGTTGSYDDGDTFEAEGFLGEGFNDVNIYLLPKGSDDIDDAVRSSQTPFDNTEHLFWEIPTDGEYEFWIYEFDSTIDFDGTDYAVACDLPPRVEPVNKLVLGEPSGQPLHSV